MSRRGNMNVQWGGTVKRREQVTFGAQYYQEYQISHGFMVDGEQVIQNKTPAENQGETFTIIQCLCKKK